MAKPIGRIWINDNMISGYVLFSIGEMQPIVIKFGAPLTNSEGEECVFLYPPKEKKETLEVSA